LWHNKEHRVTRDDLLADMWDHLPERKGVRRECDAPV
jgi:hypothetical protein